MCRGTFWEKQRRISKRKAFGGGEMNDNAAGFFSVGLFVVLFCPGLIALPFVFVWAIIDSICSIFRREK
jgi:hypothetical protein